MEDTNRPGPWIIITTIASATTALGLIVGIYIGTRVSREAREEQALQMLSSREEIHAIRDDVHRESYTPFVDPGTAAHVCIANNDAATCTVTNLTASAFTTCFESVLTQKKAAGVKLTSLPMCTGRVGPSETKTISAPWDGGFAKDICSSEGRFGPSLDFGVCDFKTDPFIPESEKGKDQKAKL